MRRVLLLLLGVLLLGSGCVLLGIALLLVVRHRAAHCRGRAHDGEPVSRNSFPPLDTGVCLS